MTDPKAGPLIALVLAVSGEMIDVLQEAFNELTDAGEHEAANALSGKLERFCMLQALVKMQYSQALHDEETPKQTPTEAITAYLQEHDADVFPISLQELQGGKLLLLNTSIGINAEAGQWLDANHPNVILSKAPRSSSLESDLDTLIDKATHGSKELDEDAEKLLALGQDPGPKFTATRKPGFTPERLAQPPRPVGAPLPHKPEINRGMPMDGPAQGMPGGKLGDR